MRLRAELDFHGLPELMHFVGRGEHDPCIIHALLLFHTTTLVAFSLKLVFTEQLTQP